MIVCTKLIFVVDGLYNSLNTTNAVPPNNGARQRSKNKVVSVNRLLNEQGNTVKRKFPVLSIVISANIFGVKPYVYL